MSDDAAYHAARERVAIFERPGSAIVEVTGAERQGYLNSLCTNEILGLESGRGVRAFLLIPQKGRVLADFLACETGDRIFLECHGGSAGTVHELLQKYYFGQEVEFDDQSESWRIFSLQGPESGRFLERTGADIPDGAEGAHVATRIGSVSGRVVRWSDTGERGFHLWVPSEASDGVYAALIVAGAIPGSRTVWDVLQIEAGMAAYGSELTDETIPLEAPTENAISHTKGCYPGQEVIARLWARGRPARHLRGLRFEGDRSLPRGATLDAEDKAVVARVTRTGVSPALGAIGLAYVHRDYVESGTRLHAGDVIAEVADLPMVPVHA